MKILFITTYYPAFLKSFYDKNGGLVEKASFKKHRKKLLDQLFGDSFFYSEGVIENGGYAEDLIVNDEILQKKWARERHMKVSDKTDFIYKIPYVRFFANPSWEESILEAQIKAFSPDVLYFHDIEHFLPKFIRRIKKGYFVVAQKASPIWRMDSFKQADLVFTSLPHFVKKFKSQGIKSEYLKLAFGRKVLSIIPKQKKIYDCTFVGGISKYHSAGTEILEEVAKKVNMDVFGYGKSYLRPESELYQRHCGEVWGREMYKVIMQSKMTINRHINIAGKYANNMRLFEATGSGTMLLTDDKVNIRDFFDVGKEVVTYKNSKDLIHKIRYYLNHPVEREKVAGAGQKRTLRDHNYTLRMREMLSLLSKYYNPHT